ncbi:hypothetical protein [Pseudarthrobacter oxydans]|uniref:hypothetical protein n=1 Tax=Pseudarthrobacter oxydans TaxID=1671 RepID=UPI0035EDC097|nr:hypothetical protein GCM10017547_38700 [Pseudarthrobacter oxydans]
MDDLWKWLGEQIDIILGVAGLATGFIFWWLSRRPKKFGWEVLNYTSIVSRVGKGLPLKVVYDGQDVRSPNLVMLRLGNAGKAELRAQDFDGPVRIEFKSGRLLAASVIDTSVPDISPEFDQNENSVSFTPSLLNAGEWISFQFVTDGPLETPRVHARVAGQTGQITDLVRERQKTWLPVVLTGLALFIVSPILGLTFEATKPLAPVALILGVCAFGLGLYGMDKRLAWARKPKAKKARRKR